MSGPGGEKRLALELREVAVEVAQEAARHVRARRPEVFGPPGATKPGDPIDAIRSKSTPTDPVTVVDTESEALIRGLLARRRPDDAVLGEEEGSGGSGVEGLRWVVDPIDGTVNFLYGIPAYSVSVAVQLDGRSLAGAVVDVSADITYSAARGAGSTRTDASGWSYRLRCNDVADAGMALVATGFGYAAERRAAQGELIAALLPRVRDIRRVGSAALDLCMVASGLVDAHFEHGLSPWDWAAGALIAHEAGAVVRVPAPESRSADGEVTVAVAPGIAAEFDEILTTLGGHRPLPG